MARNFFELRSIEDPKVRRGMVEGHGGIVEGNSSVPGVVAFVRRSPEQQVLVLVSLAVDTQHVTVDPAFAALSGTDLETGTAVALSNGLDMPAYSWRIIELK